VYQGSNGNPQSGVNVQLSNGQSAVTDFQGIARFLNLAPGNYSFSAAIPGADTGTVFTTVQPNIVTVVYTATTPLGNPQSPFPAVRATVATTALVTADRSALASTLIESRVMLRNASSLPVANVTLAIGAPTAIRINDCWAGAPGTNPCARPGNNDAQWFAGNLNPGENRGPYTVNWNSTVLPSLTTGGAFEVVNYTWQLQGMAQSFAVSLGEGVAPTPAPPSGAWLDQRPVQNWNQVGAGVPRAPFVNDPQSFQRCASTFRAPQNPTDNQVNAAGWTLFSQPIVTSQFYIVGALADVDGMCRPLQFQYFVFINNQFIGTLSPSPMNSRTDGQAGIPQVSGPTITVPFERYTASDALCCPSSTTTVTFQLASGVGGTIIAPTNAVTTRNQ
jgi:hypothetical protein